MNRRSWILSAALMFVVAPWMRADIVWPTPNRAFSDGLPYSDLVQPTVSGKTESGMFGCVRSEGHQFHEGIDLKPIRRDKRGEPADPVFAILPGVVRYTNVVAGDSSYGRYVVIEHTGEHPGIMSLYAHLLSISPRARVGARIEAGDTVGIMGHTAGGYTIPRSRAHVHVETGVWLSENFQKWYDSRKFGSRNEHGVFNGMNIIGFDFLDFAERMRAGQIQDVGEYLARLPVAVTVLVKSAFTPDFVRRYPELAGHLPKGQPIGGWRIDFTWFGLPKAWTPVAPSETESIPDDGMLVTFHDAALLWRFPCQGAVREQGGHVYPGPKVREVIDILFAGQ